MTSSRPLLVLLWFIHMTIPVFEAQEVKVQPEVTGYLGQEVTLRCQFIPGPKDDKISQVQWELKTPAGEKINIIISNDYLGVTVLDSFLKGRVKFADQSLIIQDVEMRDAGSYTCSFTSFPSGYIEGTTKLVVQVLEAQQLKMEPEVTGYLGQEVTLRCPFIPGPEDDIISQVLWALETPEGEEITIIASNAKSEVSVHDTSLKGRVKLADQSLIIQDVEMRDAGLYTCSVTVFPRGSFEGTTKLFVKEGLHVLATIITAGVFVLIVGTMLTTTFFIIRKRYSPVPSD